MGDIMEERSSPMVTPSGSPVPTRSPGGTVLSPQVSRLGSGHMSSQGGLGAGSPLRGLSPGELSAAEGAKVKLERMTKLQALVEKRKSSFAYLKKTHEGGCYWLNCVQLNRKPDLEAYAAEIPRARTTQLFYLGLSLARLLQSGCGGAAVVRGALQLFEEWEYHFAGNAAQSVRGLMAKGVDHPFPASSTQTQGQGVEGGGSASGGGEDNNPVVARLCKFGSEMVYEHLLTPPLPFALDYFEVFFSLCDIICQVYNKLMEEECYSNVHVFEALVKVDAKVKRHVLNVTAKEFTEMSAKIARSELAALR